MTASTAAAVRFACPYCGLVHRVPRLYLGRRGRCTACERVLRIREGLAERAESGERSVAPTRAAKRPAASSGWRAARREAGRATPATANAAAAPPAAPPLARRPERRGDALRFACPRCEARGQVPAACVGRVGRCHACRSEFTIPNAPPALDSDDELRIQVADLPRAQGPAPSPATAPPASADLEVAPAFERPAFLPMGPRGEAMRLADAVAEPDDSDDGDDGDDGDGDEGERGRARRRAARGRTPARRRTELDHERHVQGLGACYRVAAVLSVLAGLAPVVFLGAVGGGAEAAIGLVIAVPAIVMAVGLFLLGHFVARYHLAASIIAGVFHGLAVVTGVVWLGLAFIGIATAPAGAPVFPALVSLAFTALPTLWHLAAMFVLLSGPGRRVCEPEYRDVVAETPQVRVAWWASPMFLAPVGFVLAVGLYVGSHVLG